MVFEIKYYAKDLTVPKPKYEGVTTEYFIVYDGQILSVKTKNSDSLKTLGKAVKSYYNSIFPDISLINYEDNKKSFRKLTSSEEEILLNALKGK